MSQEVSQGQPIAKDGPSSTRPRIHVHGELKRHGDVGEPLTLVLVRHGQTEMTVDGRFSGSSVVGPGLNRPGNIEAARAADLVDRIGRDAWSDVPRPSTLIASPMTRTQETAEAIGRRLGLPIVTDPFFAEADFGQWEGRFGKDIAQTEGQELLAWHTTGTQRAPGGESVADVGVRVEEGITRLMREGTGRTVVIAAHTIVIRAAIGRALEAPHSTWNHLRITPGSVSILRRWPDDMTEVAAVGYAPL